MGEALLVAGSPAPSSAGLVRALSRCAACVVAVDRGADACHAAGVEPELFCGDADTASAEALAWLRDVGTPLDLHHPEKDETDLELALRLVRQRGVREVALTCASGGRPDHALAVFGTLSRHADLRPRVVEDEFECRVLAPEGAGEWRLGAEAVGLTFSSIALREGTVVSLSGFRWDLDHAAMELLGDLGVSNVVASPDAVVRCHAGTLAAFTRPRG